MSVLRLQDVSLWRGKTTILSHLSWQVDPGQAWVVLGANGAGKTTLSRVAAARLFHSQGSVEIMDQQLGRVDLAELRPAIGLASSALSHEVLGGEKVRDVVVSGAYGVIGRWREEYEEFDFQRADELLAALNMSDKATRTWSTLSSGERKRVEVARALMPDPELLILDEPASGLDLGGREMLLSALSQIVSQPGAPSVILVTHHLEEIPEGFTHALALREGKLVAAGPIDQVVNSQVMSQTYGLALQVDVDRGRYRARALRSA